MKDSSEEIMFFPSLGSMRSDALPISLALHGWYFNHKLNYLERFLLRSFKKLLTCPQAVDIDDSLYRERVALFLAKSTPCMSLEVNIQETRHRLSSAIQCGHFVSQLQISSQHVLDPNQDCIITYSGSPGHKQTISAEGSIHLLSERGISILSDIDDTIKVSHVSSKKDLLRNTFLYSYKPFENIASLYRDWQCQGASFHYVSTSPWQLYRPLLQFMREYNFPEGSIHLNSIFLKDGSWLNLFKDPLHIKQYTLENIIKKFPQRRFVLIGDSGERDPAIYANLYRMYPDQIAHILIRALHESDRQHIERFTFASIPPSVWSTFFHTDELDHNVDRYSRCEPFTYCKRGLCA